MIASSRSGIVPQVFGELLDSGLPAILAVVADICCQRPAPHVPAVAGSKPKPHK